MVTADRRLLDRQVVVLGTADRELGPELALATIVRAVMVPALMAIMGAYNWWLPAPLARVVRVRPSPLRAR